MISAQNLSGAQNRPGGQNLPGGPPGCTLRILRTRIPAPWKSRTMLNWAHASRASPVSRPSPAPPGRHSAPVPSRVSTRCLRSARSPRSVPSPRSARSLRLTRPPTTARLPRPERRLRLSAVPARNPQPVLDQPVPDQSVPELPHPVPRPVLRDGRPPRYGQVLPSGSAGPAGRHSPQAQPARLRLPPRLLRPRRPHGRRLPRSRHNRRLAGSCRCSPRRPQHPGKTCPSPLHPHPHQACLSPPRPRPLSRLPRPRWVLLALARRPSWLPSRRPRSPSARLPPHRHRR
jgi:hypothetical protein